jgi:probable F420-dependent oxidoreductase
MSTTASGKPRRFDGSIGTGTAQELAAEARSMESLGLDTLWAAQRHQTPFVPLAAVSSVTARVQLGTAIALAFTRSPMETALTALDMDRLTEGRFKLGLGAGVKRLNEQWHHVGDFGRPAPHLKETAELVRLLIEQGARGEAVHYRGRYHQVELRGWQPMYKAVRPSIPLYVAGVGEAMARVAGDTADGLLGHTIWSLPWIRDVIAPNVGVGLDRSHRSRADFDLSVAIPVCVSDDVAQARRDAASGIAFYATMRTYRQLFEWHGFGAEAREAQESYDAGGWSDVVIDAVSDAMVDQFTVAGDLESCRVQLEAYWPHVDSMRLEPGGNRLQPGQEQAYGTAISDLIQACISGL